MTLRYFRRALGATAVFALLALPLAAQNGSAGADWIHVDDSAREVTLDIVAGMTDYNFSWNFNGHAKGEAVLKIPVGYRVVIEFENRDKAVPHSIGVSEMQTPFPPMFNEVTPVFAGAVSTNPTSMTDSTMPGESETVAFTVDKAGAYVLVCYVPAHAVTGMWIEFVVTEGGEVSFSG